MPDGTASTSARLLTLIGAQVNEDPSLTSLTTALNQLVLLWESREPLEAHRLEEIPRLIRAAYERACYLLHNLADTPAEAANEMLESLITLRDLLRSSAADHGAGRRSVLRAAAECSRQPSARRCWPGDRPDCCLATDALPEADLFKFLAGSLNAASAQAGDQTAFLIGLLRACRELAWRHARPCRGSGETSGRPGARRSSSKNSTSAHGFRRPDAAGSRPGGARSWRRLHGGEKHRLAASARNQRSRDARRGQIECPGDKALDEDGLGSWIAAGDSRRPRGGAGMNTLARWRLVLGRFAEKQLPAPLSGREARMEAALDFLYSREYKGRGVRDRQQAGSLILRNSMFPPGLARCANFSRATWWRSSRSTRSTVTA